MTVILLSLVLATTAIVSILIKARLQAKIINGELIRLDGKIYVAKQLEEK